MRHRTRQLKTTALESLTLAVEVFNRPSPTARTQGVLLNLQHAYEMLFKAVIYQQRRRIGPKAEGKSYSFKECLGIVRGMGHLNEDEAVVAATIDAHRDGVQHQGADVTEERLYVDSASAIRLFDELLSRCFGERLADHPTFATRMLPITANPPREFSVLTSADIEHVRNLLKPGQRRRAEAQAFLRTLVLSDRVAQDPMEEVKQPTEQELERLGKQLQKGGDWMKLLPGLARLTLEQDEGALYSLRIVKSGEVPGVRVVKPGEAGAEDTVALMRVSELERYPFGLRALGAQAGLNQYDAQCFAHLLGLQDNEDDYKKLPVGAEGLKRYSRPALSKVKKAVAEGRLEEARAAYKGRRRP